MSNRVISFWSGHDSSYAVLEDGQPLIHVERERLFRVKEEPGDSIELFYNTFGDTSNVAYITTCYQPAGIQAYPQSWNSIKNVAPLEVVGHHAAHAAHAYFSSNFDEALIMTTDGGGIENASGFTAGITFWKGVGNKITALTKYVIDESDVGGLWSRITRYVFGYETGWPYGHQAGTLMALAALGDPAKTISLCRTMFRDGNVNRVCRQHPAGHVKGMSAKDPLRPRHPVLGQFEDHIKGAGGQQFAFDFAAGFQQATEEFLFDKIHEIINHHGVNSTNFCIAGGVALNSLFTGKIRQQVSHIKNVYVPPVPYDAGLTLGAAQYVWHNVMDMPRVEWSGGGMSPYLGLQHSKRDVEDAISNRCINDKVSTATDEYIIDLIDKGNVVSIFNGREESGRRALGNRSIFGDPRRSDMKDRINEKVKHRQSFRPYAPSILSEHVGEWFIDPCDSPYMGFVLKFKPEKMSLVPAVVHADGTARLQTVKRELNPWYHHFINLWYKRSGVPILLNTSFNDREPICSTPNDAIKCFLKTDIDHLYFPEFNILLSK